MRQNVVFVTPHTYTDMVQNQTFQVVLMVEISKGNNFWIKRNKLFS